MFAKACTIARSWTRPVITTVRSMDGTVESDVATYFFVTKDGWALTAGHVFDSFVRFNNDQKKRKEMAEMESRNPGCTDMSVANTLLTNHSFWWGGDGIRMSRVVVNRQQDIALVKLEGMPPITSLPVFRDPETVVPGTSLCTLGFPFTKVSCDYNAETNRFTLTKESLNLAIFPNAGMHTRNINAGKANDGTDILFLETSFSGYKGMSGGPLIDVEGRVCGLQSANEYHDQGAYPISLFDKPGPRPNVFVGLSRSVHIKSIIDLLRKNGVTFMMSASEPVATKPATAAPVIAPVKDADAGNRDSDGEIYRLD